MMKTGTLISDMMSFPMYSRSLGHQALRSCVTRACAARGSQGRRSEAAYSEVPACLLLALKHVRPAAVRALGTGLHRYEVLVAQQAARRPRDEASQHWPTRLRLPRWPPAGCGKRTCSRSPPQIEQGCRSRWLCARSWRRQVAIRRLSCAWRATSQPSSSTAASQQQLSRHTHAERVGRERVGWGGAGGGRRAGLPPVAPPPPPAPGVTSRRRRGAAVGVVAVEAVRGRLCSCRQQTKQAELALARSPCAVHLQCCSAAQPAALRAGCHAQSMSA